MIRIVHTYHGRDVPPDLRVTHVYCLVCDECGAEGPKRLGGPVDSHWDSASTRYAAQAVGWSERLFGNLLKDFCPKHTAPHGQLALPGVA